MFEVYTQACTKRTMALFTDV